MCSRNDNKLSGMVPGGGDLEPYRWWGLTRKRKLMIRNTLDGRKKFGLASTVG